MDIIHYDTISAYNASLGLETEHPLVAVVHLDRHHELHEYDIAWGLFSLWLKDTHSCLINYWRTSYDYDCNSVMGFAPGQTVHITELEHERPSCTALLFHPDLLPRTPLAGKMSRMYSRQFIMRQDINLGVMAAFERELAAWLEHPRCTGDGFPSVQMMAEKVHLSPNYFGDLVKKETGKTALEYIKLRMLDVAKQRLAATDAPVAEVAYSLGFEYPQHFTRFFKRMTTLSPSQWRQQSKTVCG